MTTETTATGRRTDAYATQAAAAYQKLSDAIRQATGRFQPAGYRLIAGRGWPAFSMELTGPQAEMLAEILDPHCQHDAAAVRNGICECGTPVRAETRYVPRRCHCGQPVRDSNPYVCEQWPICEGQSVTP